MEHEIVKKYIEERIQKEVASAKEDFDKMHYVDEVTPEFMPINGNLIRKVNKLLEKNEPFNVKYIPPRFKSDFHSMNSDSYQPNNEHEHEQYVYFFESHAKIVIESLEK